MDQKINRANITMHLIEYELTMVGHTLLETIDDDKWYFNFTMTLAQREQFHDYAIPLLKKTFKCNKSRAEETFQWFYKQFGLRMKG